MARLSQRVAVAILMLYAIGRVVSSWICRCLRLHTHSETRTLLRSEIQAAIQAEVEQHGPLLARTVTAAVDASRPSWRNTKLLAVLFFIGVGLWTLYLSGRTPLPTSAQTTAPNSLDSVRVESDTSEFSWELIGEIGAITVEPGNSSDRSVAIDLLLPVPAAKCTDIEQALQDRALRCIDNVLHWSEPLIVQWESPGAFVQQVSKSIGFLAVDPEDVQLSLYATPVGSASLLEFECLYTGKFTLSAILSQTQPDCESVESDDKLHVRLHLPEYIESDEQPPLLIKQSQMPEPEDLEVRATGKDLSVEAEGRNIRLLVGQTPHLTGPADTAIILESVKGEATTVGVSVPAELQRTTLEMSSRRARSLTLSEVKDQSALEEQGPQTPSEDTQMIPTRFEGVLEVWFALLLGGIFFIVQRSVR